MRRYEIFRKRNKRITVERTGSWVMITEETRKPHQTHWEVSVVRAPLNSLLQTLRAVEADAEVGQPDHAHIELRQSGSSEGEP